MSRSSINLDTGDPAASPQPGPAPGPEAGAGRRRFLPALPEPPRLPLALTGALIYAGIRVLGVAVAAVMLQHGSYRLRHWSVVRWMKAADGGRV